MAIAEQFAGLDMKQLIGGPLTATADASVLLANSTAEFINHVGFDTEGNVRTVVFGYQKNSVNEDGTTNLDEMKVSVPMLAIVPIPNLQVDEVNVLFDMEVKQSEKSEKSLDSATSFSGGVNLGIVKVNISGSVSTHQNNTRSSDNSAKYHVDVRATNHGTPEGMARVLDIIAANIAPALVNSTIKDANGQDLPERAKIRAEKMKALNQEMSQIKTTQGRLQEGFDKNISRLKMFTDKQLIVYQEQIQKKIDALEDAFAEEKKKIEAGISKEKEKEILTAEENKNTKVAEYENLKNEINQSWYSYRDGAAESIKALAENNEVPEEFGKAQGLLEVKEGEKGKLEKADYDSGQVHYKTLKLTQETAVKSRIEWNNLEKSLAEKEAEYGNLVARTESISNTEDGGK